METSPRKLNSKFTYKDYLSWTNDKERWELIEGDAYDMSPAPTRWHQSLSSFLHITIGKYLDNNDCQIFAAPFDVRLPGGFKADSDVETVVQPDISVFCDKKKLDDRGGNGAPDLIIEILSPSTASKDLKEKFFLYEKVGVREYWIVDPSNKTLTAFILGEKGRYVRGVVYAGEDVLKTDLFEGLEIRMEEVFTE
ncbi:MAG: Uma2 family endonuclease [Spirochaetota bacterium]|nr:Uma2 family endonuclease [Spirochaetota bacterium]